MRYLLPVALVLALAAPSQAKPAASRTASMTAPASGVKMTFSSPEGKKTAYGYAAPFTVKKADVGKYVEVVVDSPKPLTIELWTENLLQTTLRNSWLSSGKCKYLGSSGAPSRTPSFRFLAEKEGEYTLLFLDVIPATEKTGTFVFNYGREIRTPTEADKAEWEKAVAAYKERLRKQEETKRNTWIDFQATALDEKPISASMYPDKVVLVVFFSGADTASREEMPDVITLYDKYRGKGFDVIGISSDESVETLNEYLKTLSIKWRTVHDAPEGEAGGTLAQRYNVTAVPASFLIDHTGLVVGRSLTGKELEDAVAKAVAANQAAIIAAAEKENVEKPEAPKPETQ